MHGRTNGECSSILVYTQRDSLIIVAALMSADDITLLLTILQAKEPHRLWLVRWVAPMGLSLTAKTSFSQRGTLAIALNLRSI